MWQLLKHFLSSVEIQQGESKFDLASERLSFIFRSFQQTFIGRVVL